MLASATKQQYLKAMGIDVWRLRRDSGEGDIPVDAVTSPAPTPAAEPAEAADAAPASPPPRFHLCFATYGPLSLVFSVPDASTSLPEEMRRFVDDVARAMNIEANPSVSALRWPMVKAANIDQSESAARVVVEQRLADCGDIRLVFGETAAQWVTATTDPLPALETCMQDAEHKRALWRTLKRVLAS